MRTNKGAVIALSAVIGLTGLTWYGTRAGAAHLPSGTPTVGVIEHVLDRDCDLGDKFIYRAPVHFRYDRDEIPKELEEAAPIVRDGVADITGIISEELRNMPLPDERGLDNWGERMENWGEQLEQRVEPRAEALEQELEAYENMTLEERRELRQEYKQRHHEHMREHKQKMREFRKEMHEHGKYMRQEFETHMEELGENIHYDGKTLVIEEDGKTVTIEMDDIYKGVTPMLGKLGEIPTMLSAGLSTMPEREGKTEAQYEAEMRAWGESFGEQWEDWGEQMEKLGQGLEYQVEQSIEVKE